MVFGRIDGQRSPVLPALLGALFACLGVVLVGMFINGTTQSIEAGILTLFACAVVGILFPAAPRLGMLNRLMVVLYALPYSVLLGYLIEHDYIWMLTTSGMDIIQDRVLIQQMIAVGTIGMVGLIVGMQFAALAFGRAVQPRRWTGANMSIVWFVPLAVLAVVLSWLSTPKETIFQAAYFVEQSETLADQVKFAAAYLVSYIVLLVLTIDAERTTLRSLRLVKLAVIAATVGFIVIDLQLLRGNRESSGLLVALFGLFVTAPYLRGVDWRAARAASWRRLRRAILPMLLLGGIFISLGEVRGTATDLSARLGVRETFLLGLSQNTWSAVLWTNLSAAYMYRTGMLRWRYGQTYVDYLLSLPPGFITDAFGIDRPATSHNLAAEDPAGVSSGGLHVVITPFKNFGAPGVLVVMAISGFFIGWVEWNHARGTLGGRVLYATVLCSSFQWFWYGDLVFIRAMLSAAAVFILYRVLVWINPQGSADAPALVEQPV